MAGKEFAASLVTMNRRQKVWIQKNVPLRMDDAILELDKTTDFYSVLMLLPRIEESIFLLHNIM